MVIENLNKVIYSNNIILFLPAINSFVEALRFHMKELSSLQYILPDTKFPDTKFIYNQ